MEVLKAMKFDRITYDCSCKYCGVKVTAEKDDFVWNGDLNVSWTCPICCMRNKENVISLRRKKVTHYKVVDIEKG